MNDITNKLYNLLIARVNEETTLRKRIEELQKDKNVIEYLTKTNTKPIDVNLGRRDILKNILEHLFVDSNMSSNNIYICTDAFSESMSVSMDDPSAIIKIYRDIEADDNSVLGIKKGIDNPEKYRLRDTQKYYNTHSIAYIDEFERDHVIINPYTNDDSDNSDNFSDIRIDYFDYLLDTKNQDEAIDKLLVKYPRL